MGVGVDFLARLNGAEGGLVSLADISREIRMACPEDRKSKHMMVQDNRLVLDRLRQEFLPDCPKVYGNRLWFTLLMNKCNPEITRAFFAKANLQERADQVGDWMSTPFPEIFVGTEKESQGLVDNRPCLRIHITMSPDGSIHSSSLGGTRPGYTNQDRVGRKSISLPPEASHLFLSLAMRMIFPSLRSPESGPSL